MRQATMKVKVNLIKKKRQISANLPQCKKGFCLLQKKLKNEF